MPLGVGRARLSIGTVVLAVTVGAAGCGGGERQDKNEPSGSFPVEVVRASFPAQQHLSQATKLEVTVRNAGNKAIPVVALTLSGKNGSEAEAFGQSSTGPSAGSLASTSRPIWIVDSQPENSPTAYVNTWALGRLAPHKSKTFRFGVTPVKPGRYTIRYRVAAGLNGKAKAVAPGGGPVRGQFVVQVSGKPRDAVSDTSGGG